MHARCVRSVSCNINFDDVAAKLHINNDNVCNLCMYFSYFMCMHLLVQPCGVNPTQQSYLQTIMLTIQHITMDVSEYIDVCMSICVLSVWVVIRNIIVYELHDVYVVSCYWWYIAMFNIRTAMVNIQIRDGSGIIRYAIITNIHTCSNTSYAYNPSEPNRCDESIFDVGCMCVLVWYVLHGVYIYIRMAM